MNLRVIAELVRKDTALFFRNKFFVTLTILGVVAYIVIYFLMPASVDETLEIGLYSPGGTPSILDDVSEQGLEIQTLDSEEALKQAVLDGQYVAGVALPVDFMDRIGSDEKPRINVYFGADVTDGVKNAVESLIEELAYIQTGQPLPVEISQEIVGIDMAGSQVPPRDRLRPVFAVLLLITETLFLATLISEEVERRTIQALLVTPVKVRDFLGAKGVVGVSLAFGETLLFVAIVGGLAVQPLPIVIALLLGAVLVTGISFFLATMGRDMMSVMAWGIPVVVVMVIPAMSVLFPGALTGWIKVIPSYYLVDTVNQVANFGGGWGDVWVNLLALAGFGVAFFWLGGTLLVRRFQ